MKLSTMLKSALALGLGFVVGTAVAGTDSSLYTEDFSTNVVDQLIKEIHTDADPANGYGWYAGEEDESKIAGVPGESDSYYLKLNTESGTLTNKLASGVADALNAAIAGTAEGTEGAYFEFDAKFVASDSLDAGITGGTDDTKLALYAYYNEDANPPYTNLVVFHAYYDSEFNMLYTNDVTDIAIDTEVLTHVRIDMTQVDVDGAYLNAFTVKVGTGADARTVETANAYDSELGSATGSLFLTAEKWSITANQSVSSLAFKGTGDIDNIAVGTVTGETPAPTIFMIGENEYTTIEAALAALKGNDTLKLCANIESDTALSITNKNITLDLGGKTITFKNCDGIYFKDCTGVVSNGTVVMSVNAANNFGAIGYEDADGLVKDVTVNAGNAKWGVYTCSAGNDHVEKLVTCENVDVSGCGGLFYCETEEMLLDNDCSATQSGTGFSAAIYNDAVAAGWLGELTITGGTYTAEGNAIATMSSPATIEISGGTFTGAITVTPVASAYTEMGEHKIAITGGTFSVDPSAYVVSGYKAVENATDPVTWTVQKIPAAPVATVISVAGAEPVEYSDLHEALVDGSAAGSVVELIANVDLADVAWEPVAGFAGTFDGKGFIVSNLTITAADVSGNYAGLFTQLSSDAAVVRNLTFENVSLHADNSEYLGTIVGHINSASPAISNITVCGKIDILGKKYVGGIAGFLYFGGLVDCHVDGGDASESTIATLGKQCGGLNGTYVSGSEGNMTCYDCTVKNVTITGPEQLGGLTGRAFRLASYVNCSVEDVIIKATKSTSAIGGLIGDVYNAYGHGRFLIGCSATDVSLQDADGATVTYTDFGTDTTIDYLMVSSDAEAENFATFAKWNYGFTAGTFTDVGKDGNMVAVLEANCAEGYEVVDNGDDTYTVRAIKADPTVIRIASDGVTTVEYTDLHLALSEAVSGDTVKLVSNVDLAGVAWEPIAGFAGTFDGDGYIVSNLTITAESGNNQGMFATLVGAKIYNLIIENISVNAPNSMYVGGITGDASGAGAFTNITLRGTINIVGYKYVAGIFGYSSVSAWDCVIDGGNKATSFIGQAASKVDEGQVGGILGMTPDGCPTMQIFGCSVKNISMFGNERMGGIAGRLHTGPQILNCTVENVDIVNTTDASSNGAIVGVLKGNSIIANNTASSVTINGSDFGTKIVGTSEGKSAVGTGFEGDSFTFGSTQYNLTAGTFTPDDADGLARITAQIKTGYEAKDNGDGTYTIQLIPPVSEHDIDLGDGCYIDGIAGTEGAPNTIEFTSIDIAEGTVGILAGEIKTATDGSACTLTACEELGGETFPLAATIEADADDATKGIITITGDISEYDTLFFTGIGPAAAE